MPWRENFYSRLVAWLKILLPVAALGLLSTLFLLSRSVDPTVTTPFTTIDLHERAREQVITAPEFAGATDEGHLISMRAVSAKPDPAQPSRAFATALSARIELNSGTVITFTAARGIVDETADRAELTGNVVIDSSTGYYITTDHLISGMREVRAETPGPINAIGPPGRFSAGKMILTADKDGENTHLLFTNGVKLVYEPVINKE
jgi:lipopolysaccharide export system protein LptC